MSGVELHSNCLPVTKSRIAKEQFLLAKSKSSSFWIELDACQPRLKSKMAAA